MIGSAFDRLASRVTNDISRRRSLVALSAASIAALIGSPAAAKNKKSGSHNCKKKCKQRCQTQVEPCRNVILSACANGGGDTAGCQQRLLPCCDPLATCDAGSAFQCIATNAGG